MLDWHNIEKTHRAEVWAVVYRVLANEHDARDCCQEVFLEAMRQCPKDVIRAPGAWLRWLATRRAIDFLRARKRRATVPLSDTEHPPAAAVTDHSDSEELMEVVRRELTRLPESQATAFWLFSVEDRSYEEIAELTGRSVNAVGLQVHRARQVLKRRLSSMIHHLAEN